MPNKIEGEFYIVMTPHGVNGAAVQVDDATVKDCIRQIKNALRKHQLTRAMIRDMHEMLAKELSNMMMKILRTGQAVDSKGETYDKAKFDNDLVWCAVYDHIGNGKKIHVQKDVGPPQGQTVHQ
jgi:hypothetical protein